MLSYFLRLPEWMTFGQCLLLIQIEPDSKFREFTIFMQLCHFLKLVHFHVEACA